MICLDDKEQIVIGLYILDRHDEATKLRRSLPIEQRRAMAKYMRDIIDKAKAHVEET